MDPGPSILTPTVTPPAQSLCAICSSQQQKYTCPRCALKSCSLECSKAHKASSGCTGERDPAAFVPMNAYGYAALVNDYTFLEDVGRRVEGWGREIVRDGIDRRERGEREVRGVSMRSDRGRGRGRGRGMGMGRMGQAQERRRYLAKQLALRDVDVDVLPSGMERAQRNRSFWDSKGKKALMTVEFVFKPPSDPYSRQASKLDPLTAHKMDWTTSIRSILRSSLKNSNLKRNEHLMQWLALDDENDEQSSVLSLLKKPRDPSEPYNKQEQFYKLDWNTPLSKALRFKQITEFPAIHLVDETVFEGVLVEDDGTRTDVQRVFKRQRVDEASGKKAIATLVGSYGSDEEFNSEGESKIDHAAALDTLAGYAGSDDDNNDDGSEASYDDEQDAEGETDEEYAEFISSSAACHKPPTPTVHIDDEEAVDWGDDEIAEDEAKIASLSAALQQRFPAS